MVRRNARMLFVLLAVLGLVASACSKAKTVTPQASSTPIPSVNIGDCVTNQGTVPPAAATGADFKTQLKEPGILNVGSDNAFPPFEEIPAGAKEPVGFDVDIYKEIAKRLGLTAKSTTTDFDGLFTGALSRGQFDVGISAITIKESRKQGVDFTIPYFRADLSLAVDTTKTPNIKSVDDLAGVTIGVQDGTTGADCADALVKLGKAKDVKRYRDAPPAFDDLVAGRVGAVVNDRPASEGIIATRPSVKVVQVIKTEEEYGIAIGKQKPDLRESINNTLTDMMTDGTYAAIYKVWFKTDVPFSLPLS